MYRYFSSKEEIFLNVFVDLFGDWFEGCCKRLQKLKQEEDEFQALKPYFEKDLTSSIETIIHRLKTS